MKIIIIRANNQKWAVAFDFPLSMEISKSANKKEEAAAVCKSETDLKRENRKRTLALLCRPSTVQAYPKVNKAKKLQVQTDFSGVRTVKRSFGDLFKLRRP